MGFDYENFGLGLLTGWASAYAIYRLRPVFRSVVQTAGQQAATASNYATRSADRRYIDDIVEFCEQTHLAGRHVKLSDILVEPRFVPAPKFAAPRNEDHIQSVFHVIPHVPDHPYLQAPFNLETLSIDALAGGDRALALLGLPGSGRTTAMMAIILRSLGKIGFEPPVDKVQARLDEEEAQLPEKERNVRRQQRLAMEQRAKEQLAEQQGVAFDAEEDEKTKSAIALFNRMMPIYVHMAEVHLGGEFGKEVDPAEPLVRAVQREVGRVAASTIPRSLYERLNKGQALLLFDGYDDLPEDERQLKLSWLEALLREYSQNFFIVAGPAIGYGPLTRLGLSPIFIRPWMDLDMDRAAERWAQAWPQMGAGRRKRAVPDDASLERAKTNNRALSPFELTLKIWANYAGDVETPGLEGWMRAYLARQVPGLQTLLPQMAQTAAMQLDRGFITQKLVEATVPGASEPKVPQPTDDAEPPEAPVEKIKTDTKKKAAEATAQQNKLLAALQRAGLLVRYSDDRYQFRDAPVASYLASLTLQEVAPDQLMEKASSPAWSHAFAYAALHTPLDEVVRVRMSARPDVLQTQVLECTRWLAHADSALSWREPLLEQVSNMLTAPNQYPAIRERAAAALITTRDRNVLLTLKQAARHANPDVRRLACLGMGAVGDPDSIPDLQPLLEDADGDVQLAAALALGAIATEEALEAMVMAFTEGSEQLRQAIAEALAAHPDEGHSILYDAVSHDEMMLRRAAIFGLRRINATWAFTSIYRAFLEDEQWYVRSAAQQAFLKMQLGGRDGGVVAYPSVAAIEWLNEWAAKRGESIPAGEGANQILLKALQEGDAEVKALSAASLGQLGVVTTTRPLYAALRDRQEEVRVAAHRALADLEMQIGKPLPAPA